MSPTVPAGPEAIATAPRARPAARFVPATPEADVTVLGGGPVGLATALLLARQVAAPERIVLCHRPDGPFPEDDPRALALNHGSRTLLERLGAWPAGGGLIQTVHVSQRGRLGRTLIQHTDFDVPALGTVLPYGAVVQALARAVAAAGVRMVEAPGRLDGLRAAGMAVQAGGTAFTSRLVVQAEGGLEAGGRRLRHGYLQHAVLATVSPTQPQPGWAWERFTQDGPLALLPLASATPGERLALVWCCTPTQADALLAAEPAAFEAALGHAFGTRLGELRLVSARHRFPLAQHLRLDTVGTRRVTIGNAAQSLHPVAGQGLNLGLRDAAVLAQRLAPWLARPERDPAPVLRDYASQRRADRWLTAGATDLMPRIFTTRLPLVEHACGLGLLSLDLSGVLRAPLARHLMQGWRS